MKQFVIFCALCVCSIVLTGCPANLDLQENDVIFAHYVEDSLSQYVYAFADSRWESGFIDTISPRVKKWNYPGTWGFPPISVSKIQNGDFLYKCKHDMYVGYPYTFGITGKEGVIYNVKWKDVANSNYSEATIIEKAPFDYYIKLNIDDIKKHNHRKDITSGEQLVEVVNRMMEDGSFIESIQYIGSQRESGVWGNINDYRQYVEDYRNGLVENPCPIIEWLLEE